MSFTVTSIIFTKSEPTRLSRADKIKAASVGTQVDELLDRAQQTWFVGLGSGRRSGHVVGSRYGPVDAKRVPVKRDWSFGPKK